MYTDITKIKETSLTIPKGEFYHFLKDGRLCIYDIDFLIIFNMDKFKEELTINNETFLREKEIDNIKYYSGELVCLTELSNGYLVLGFGRGYNFTNLIIDIKGNEPKLIKTIEINDEDYCCRNLITFNIGNKEYFIAGDNNPEIYKAKSPFNKVAT